LPRGPTRSKRAGRYVELSKEPNINTDIEVTPGSVCRHHRQTKLKRTR